MPTRFTPNRSRRNKTCGAGIVFFGSQPKKNNQAHTGAVGRAFEPKINSRPLNVCSREGG